MHIHLNTSPIKLSTAIQLEARSHAMNSRRVLVFRWGGEHGGGGFEHLFSCIHVYHIVFNRQDGWGVARFAFKMRMRKPQRQLNWDWRILVGAFVDVGLLTEPLSRLPGSD
jgi:hypothetical protein